MEEAPSLDDNIPAITCKLLHSLHDLCLYNSYGTMEMRDHKESSGAYYLFLELTFHTALSSKHGIRHRIVYGILVESSRQIKLHRWMV